MKRHVNINYAIKNKALILLSCMLFLEKSYGQKLSLKAAVDKAVANYGMLSAKSNYARFANEKIIQIKRAYLPNLSLSAQQDYGTINGQSGPLYGLGGLAVASSGSPLATQNWNAAFGALYLVNINWELYNFGRTKQQITLAKSEAAILERDYQQELFQHKIKVAGAYLNLLASQRLQTAEERNLARLEVFYNNIAAKVKSGLLPGVDLTTAAAEVSNATIKLNRAKEQVKIQNNTLTQLLGEPPFDVVTDTTIFTHTPKAFEPAEKVVDSLLHPTRQFFQSRIAQSLQQEKVFKKEYAPAFYLFGVFQTRGSGFNADYVTDQKSFTHNYFDGIKPVRQNYLLGFGLVWSLTSAYRAQSKIDAQKFITQGLQDEYKTINIALANNDNEANARIKYALQNLNETPLQVKAAQQAYIQRVALYNNGLANLTEVTAAQYVLNRAETDYNIAFINVWQALLMKAASTGNFNLFINEF